MDESQRTIDNDSQRRFELWEGELLVGWATYRDQGQVRVLTHVEVTPERRGHGVGGQIVSAFLNRTEQLGLRTYPTCGYAASWIRKHPEVQHQVAREL
jgi:uncharacterized protein